MDIIWFTVYAIWLTLTAAVALLIKISEQPLRFCSSNRASVKGGTHFPFTNSAPWL
jgi:hypothetical protein